MTVNTPHFSSTPYSAPDPMFELKAAYDADPSPSKITLGPGAYQDEAGKPWILPSVASAEERMAASHPGHEYLPILGLPAFRRAARTIVFGPASDLLSQSKVATIQTISGTGAVHIAAVFLHNYHPGSTVYVSDPSWSNHRIMFEYVGFKVDNYEYYDPATKAVNFSGMKVSLNSADPGSIFVLHPCAHNPTGCDLSREQWAEIGSIMKTRKLVPVLDSAYQGFASGDLDRDAWPIRHLLEELALPGLVCQSFSKSMGLYGERVGALHVVVPRSPASTISNIESQLGWISRKEISTAGRYGATIATTIIETPELFHQWRNDLLTMSCRIHAMRTAVVFRLAQLGTPGSWKHVTDQIGMFSYTGLSRAQVMWLRDKHIYMAENGRMSISGLNEKNVGYFCKCVDEAVRSV